MSQFDPPFSEDAQRRLSALIGSIDEIVFECDAEGRYLSIWTTSDDLLVRPREELLGKRRVDVFDPEVAAPVDAAIRRVLETGQPESVEYALTVPRGHTWFLARVSPIPSPDGPPRTVALLARDITERKRTEEELRSAKESLDAIIHATPLAVMVISSESLVEMWNPAAERMFGWTEEEILGRHNPMVPSDKRAEHEALRERVLSGASFTGKEIRRQRKNGTWIDVSLSTAGIHDESGRVTRVLAVLEDITDRKRAVVALSESERRLREMLENINLVSVMLDTEGRIVACNPFLLSLTGWSSEELIGGNWFDLFIPANIREAIRSIFLRTIREGEFPVHFENEIMTRTGDLRFLSWNNTVLRDSTGAIIGVSSLAVDMTERIEAERVLRESELRFRTLFNHAGDAIFIHDSEGRLLEVNDVACSRLGYSREQLLSMSLAQVDTPQYVDFMEERTQLLQEEGWAVFESEHQRADGTLIPVEVSVRAVEFDGRPAAMGIARDVTNRREALQALRSSEEKYRALVEGSSDAIFLESTGGRILDCNDAACRMFGFTKDEMIGLHTGDLVPEESAAPLPGVITDDETTLGVPVERVNRRKDGTLFPTEISTRLFDVGGEARLIAWVRDISERKRQEERRERLEVQVQQAQKMESLGVLAGGIAHDFNNLLTGILGNADLALLELSPLSPARESLRQIELAARRAAELTRQMLAYSGRGPFIIRALDLSELVQEMSHLLEVSITKKCVLKYHFAESLPAVEADASQLRQVVMNLIINASEAIGEKSGVIAATTGAMMCDRDYLAGSFVDEQLPPGMYVYLEVVDTGCGMDAETREKVFDPFFTTKFTGRGLGLAAVLGIVRGHHGAIKVYSEPGRGTSFKVLFPAVSEAAESTPGAPEDADAWRGSGTVLVVDDEETVRTLASRMLERMGFSVLLAEDGRHGVDMYDAHRDEIVAVLLDMTMPHMDGEETFRELRRKNKNVCVVLSSGYNESEATTGFKGKGLSGFIQKPYRSEDLTAVMRSALEA